MKMVEAVLSSVDFAAIAIGIGTIAGLVAVALVAKKGAAMLLGMLGR
ncbi:hypothetical protein [Phytopseudomonas daroniae]|nr:hypothetical protein [Pseudomonas daroniae]